MRKKVSCKRVISHVNTQNTQNCIILQAEVTKGVTHTHNLLFKVNTDTLPFRADIALPFMCYYR